MRTPTHLLIREFRLSLPSELGWRNYPQEPGESKIEIEYQTEQRGDFWWYNRKIYDTPESERILVSEQLFGPYQDQFMAIERMERARRTENIPNTGGALNQNLNAPSDRAMINDIFGYSGLGVAAMVPRR